MTLQSEKATMQRTIIQPIPGTSTRRERGPGKPALARMRQKRKMVKA
jgi:hypothetical protein